MKALFGLAALAIAVPAPAQWPGDQEIPAVAFPVLPTTGETVAGFVPKGWKLEREERGDLNGDGRPDAALVLHMDRASNRIHPSWAENITYDTNPRVLAIVFAVPGQGYRLAASDHALIPRLENPNQDDPFDRVTIADGALRVRLQLFMSAGGWRMGNATFALRWKDGAMRLVGYDSDWTERNSAKTEQTSINFLTGRKLVSVGSIENDRQTRRTTMIKRRPLLALGKIGDGLMFEPGAR